MTTPVSASHWLTTYDPHDPERQLVHVKEVHDESLTTKTEGIQFILLHHYEVLHKLILSQCLYYLFFIILNSHNLIILYFTK